MMEIRRLDPQEYAGYALQFEYVTDHVYDVQADENGFSLELTRLDRPLRKAFTDTLFSEWLEEPVAFGAFDGETLAGVFEGSPEAWHNVFRISNILVQPEYRRRGVGQMLMDSMLDFVRRNTRVRGVILETQTCNAPAIRFYRKNGFRLSRIDIREYSNEDVEKREVRIDLFLPLEG